MNEHEQNSRKCTQLRSPVDRRRHPIEPLRETNFINCAEERLNVFVSKIEITAIHDDDIPKRKDGSTPVIVQFLSADKNSTYHASKKETKA